MTWFRLPLFIWSHLCDQPDHGAGHAGAGDHAGCCMALERIRQSAFSIPKLGGDPVLFQHLFWFYSHPAVYIMILPGMGVISELITCFSRKRIFGYRFVAFASMAIAVFGFLVWGHHMFVSGAIDLCRHGIFVLEFHGGDSVGDQGVQLDRDTVQGLDLVSRRPMLYALGFIGLFTIGGLTGLFLAALAVDVHVHRHLLRRRAFPLHHGGRHGDGVSWGACTTGGRRLPAGCIRKAGRRWRR